MATGRAILAALVLATAVVGCASTINENMQSWVGHHQSELIQAWGPPTRTASDGKGGRVLIYEHWVDLGQRPGTVRAVPGGATYTEPERQGYTQTRMFYVDRNGRIYSWRWQGL